MENPESIFAVISVLVLSCVVYRLTRILRAKEKNKLIGLEILISLLVVGFAWIWFVPIELGFKDQSSVCKFRLQVFLCDWHDYGGYGNIEDLIIRLEPDKYGRLVLYERVGGWQAYLGLEDIDLN